LSKPLWKPGLALLAIAQFFAWSMPIPSFARQPGKKTKPDASASPIQVTADFSVPEGYPLVKDKIGVYQTPFMGIHGRPPLIQWRIFFDLREFKTFAMNSLGENKTPMPTHKSAARLLNPRSISLLSIHFYECSMRTASSPCWPSPTILFRCRLVLPSGRPDVGVHRCRRRMDGRKY
jgi:hypothetical protein